MVSLLDVYFPFLPLESIQFLTWDVRSVQKRYLPKFSATFDVRISVLKPIVRRISGEPASDILKISRLN